jgi:hypothetical protein
VRGAFRVATQCRLPVADIGPLAEQEAQGIFGVPLQQSVRYANVAISLSDAQGQSYIYGYVPIVVAKCGVFLKEKGMFRSESKHDTLRNN